MHAQQKVMLGFAFLMSLLSRLVIFFNCSNCEKLGETKLVVWWIDVTNKIDIDEISNYSFLTTIILSQNTYSLIVLQECISFEVSGGYTWTRGTYVVSDEKISNDSGHLLWKKTNLTMDEKQYYIFNEGSSNGWQIGFKEGLEYIAFYKSKTIWFLFDYFCTPKLMNL